MIFVDDLRIEIKDYNFNALTEGDEAIATRCIEKAVTWIEAKSKVQDIVIDFDDQIINEIILKRALYELYSYAENEEIARDKKQDAFELLKGYLKNSKKLDGDGYDGGGNSCVPNAVVASIVSPKEF